MDYYHTKASVNEYIKLAKNHNGQQLIDLLPPHLNANDSILELGSGPGTDWKILQNHYAATGSDYSTEFLNHLSTTYPEGTFLQLNAETLDTELQFDAIYSNKVLQHLKDTALKKSIQRQSVLLNTNGVVCHSFWNGSGEETFKGMYVNYQNEKSLRSLFGSKFEILHLALYQEFEPNDSIVVLAKKIE